MAQGTRPAVGDLGFFQQHGSTKRELAIVTGHNGDGSVQLHVLGTSEWNVNADEFIGYSVTPDGDIPSAPIPEPPPPAKKIPTW